MVDVVADGDRFLDIVDRLSIDVGVIGWVIPPGDGKFILDQLRGRASAPRIIVYTGATSSTVVTPGIYTVDHCFDEAMLVTTDLLASTTEIFSNTQRAFARSL